jgi:hypothetical protein
VLIAEFETKEQLLVAIAATHGKREAYMPYDVEGVQEALGLPRSRIGWIALASGLAGGGGAFALEWWINCVDYPLNLGGRPDFSWPAFIPIAFEMTVLFAAAATLIACLVLGGLPRLWHPVFEIAGFERASIDRFWLSCDDDALAPALVAAGALRVVPL